MAAKTYYVLGTAAPSPNFFGQLQDGGTAPTAANSTYGWGPAKTSTGTPYYAAFLGASSTSTTSSATSSIDSDTSPGKGTGATNTTAGDSFVAPAALTGNFANTAWTFNWNMRAGVAGAVGRIRMRVWASVNASGASARELTAGAQLGAIVTLSTTADTNSSISWSPGGIGLNNEFLFFQLEWQETTAGSSNTDTVLFRIGTATIVTPNFTLPVVNQLVIPTIHSTEVIPTAGLAVKGFPQITASILVFGYITGANQVNKTIIGKLGISSPSIFKAIVPKVIKVFSSEVIVIQKAISHMVSIAKIVSVSDNFNRADGPLGSNWVDSPTLSGLSIVSNQAANAPSAWALAYCNPSVNTFSNDQYSEIVCATGSFVGPVVRHQLGSSSGYFYINNGQIYRIDSGSFTNIANASVGFTYGDTVRISISGSTITVFVNGVLKGTVTDTTYATGQPGIAAYNGSLDNWLGGSIAAVGANTQIISLIGNRARNYISSLTSHSLFVLSKTTLHLVTIFSTSLTTVKKALNKITSLVSSEIVTKSFPLIRMVLIASSQALVFSRSVPFAVISRFSLLSMITGANFVTKNVTGKLSIVSQEILVLAKRFPKLSLILNPEILTFNTISSRLKTFVLSIAETVTIAQQYIPGTIVNQKLVSITESSLVTLARIKTFYRTVVLSASEIVIVSNIKTFYRTYVIAFPENVTTIRIASKLKLVTYANLELVSLTRSTARSLLVVSLETVTLARISSRFRIIVSSIGEAVTQFNQKAFLRTLIITSSEVFTYTKSIIKAFSITSLETVILAKISSRFRTVLLSSGEIVTQFNQKAFLRTLIITSSEVMSYTLLKARVFLVSLTQSEIVTRVSLNVKTIIVSTSEIVRRQAVIAKALVAQIRETVLAFTGNTVFSVINHPQIISIYKITGRLIVLFQSQLVSLTRISSKLTSFVNHELVTQFNQKAFLKIVFPLHHEVLTRISVVSRTLSFANSSVTIVNRIISRAVVLTQSQLASFVKATSRTVVFTNHEVITSTFGKLYKRAVSIASPEALVSVRSFTKQFLLSQFQLITRSSISTKLVSVVQSEVVQRSLSIPKNIGLVSSEILVLLRPTRSKAILLHNSSILFSTRVLGRIINIITSQKFFKAAIDVPINFAQTQFVKTTGSISRKLFLFNRSSINVIAGKVRGILASIKTSQFWSYVTSKFWYLPNFLQPDGMLSFEWVTIKGWTPVASGLNLAIGILLEVRRGECLIAYTPSLDIPPTLPYAVDNQGDIRLLVDSQIAWIRSADPNAYITVKGRIEYTAKRRIAA